MPYVNVGKTAFQSILEMFNGSLDLVLNATSKDVPYQLLCLSSNNFIKVLSLLYKNVLY